MLKTYKSKEPIKGMEIEDSSITDYLNYVDQALNFFESVDTRKPEPFKPYLDKADKFLRKHAGISYEDFLNLTDAAQIQEDDFALLPKDNLRRRLFVFRARAYLSALEIFENQHPEIDIKDLLKKIKQAKIPGLKKGEKEPVLEKIIEVLK
ncbi:MAG: hypothetical protein AABW58_00820 [Nanoarchaeota archaeon]